jgi:hypothetical protein
MRDEPEDPRTDEDDEIEQENAAPLPSREAMSIIDVTPGPKIPYEPADGFTTDPGSEIPDDRYEE